MIIAAAQASEEVAAAQLSLAKVLWLPNINLGASYYRHDGAAQGNSGTFYDNARNQTLVGGGASAVVATTDAIFTPLAARQVVRSRNLVVQAARNDALLAVAESYFNVQQARGRLAGAEDSVMKARSLVTTVHALSAGLVAPIEINRAQTVLASLEQSYAAAQGSWGAASAELTRVLRLDPTAMVLPMEPPHLQVTLIASRSDHRRVDSDRAADPARVGFAEGFGPGGIGSAETGTDASVAAERGPVRQPDARRAGRIPDGRGVLLQLERPRRRPPRPATTSTCSCCGP